MPKKKAGVRKLDGSGKGRRLNKGKGCDNPKPKSRRRGKK